MKLAGETYLSRLGGQNDAEYQAYKRRAMWYGATERTVTGLTGAMTRKDPAFTVPDAMLSHLDDMTMGGVPAHIFVKGIITELLITGCAGVLVDMASSLAMRPYWVAYTCEQILNWRTAYVNGAQVLTMVVLSEGYDIPHADDVFTVSHGTRYRVLAIEDGQYVVRIYTPNAELKEQFDVEEFIPVYRGEPMREIPFCFFGTNNLSPVPDKPPLLDLVDVNYSHYMSSADLEHGRHFTALPTPWIAGFPKDTRLSIGSSIAWCATDANAKAGMLEFTGQGLGAIEKALESKEHLMAVLGARLLEQQKSGVEATDTIMLRSAGERSVLQSMALIVGLGLTRVLRWHAVWMGIQETHTIHVVLNSDFIARPMTSMELTALVAAWQAEAISYETLYWSLQRGELARPGITADNERTLIEVQGAARALTLNESVRPSEEVGAHGG